MERAVYIYALCDPDTGAIHYVGKSVNVEARYQGHLSDGFNSNRVSWINGLQAQGKQPLLKILETTTEAQWHERERHWITYLREQGEPLTNIREGGVGDNAIATYRPSVDPGDTYQFTFRTTRQMLNRLERCMRDRGRRERTPFINDILDEVLRSRGY